MKKEENVTSKEKKKLGEKLRVFKLKTHDFIEKLPPLIVAVIMIYFFYLVVLKLKEKTQPIQWLEFFGVLFSFLGVVEFLNVMVIPKIITQIESEEGEENTDKKVNIIFSIKIAIIVTVIGIGLLILSMVLPIWLKRF